MSKSNLQETLARLNKMTSQKKGTGGKKIKYYKAKNGRNEILVLPFKETDDPFLQWGEHKNLQDPGYLSVPCSAYNHGESCPVCDVVSDLKNEDWQGNKDIWMPIETKTRFYSPVIDLKNIDEGVQWFSYGKTVLAQFETWLMNLEEDELPFYDLDSPEKVIINYDKEADASLRYKLDRKILKKIPDEIFDLHEDGLEGIADEMEDIKELLDAWKKSDDVLAQMIDDYLKAITAELEEEKEEEEKEEEDSKKDKKKNDEKLSKKSKSDKKKNDDNDDDDNDDDDDDEKSSKKSKSDDVPKLRRLRKS
jgi:hypothetical protein